MQLTKQQRKEVYLRAVEFFSKIQGKNYWSYFNGEGFCDYIETNEVEDRCNKFPEYMLFKPKKRMPEFVYWFNVKDKPGYGAKLEQRDRITALLLAAEMCND